MHLEKKTLNHFKNTTNTPHQSDKCRTLAHQKVRKRGGRKNLGAVGLGIRMEINGKTGKLRWGGGLRATVRAAHQGLGGDEGEVHMSERDIKRGGGPGGGGWIGVT